MKKTPFGAFLTPALTGRPPAGIRIGLTLLRITRYPQSALYVIDEDMMTV